MLEKMGWKHGEGLGRDKQGIVAPLVARKTDKHSGVIVQGQAQNFSANRERTPTVSQLASPAQETSRIVLLTVAIFSPHLYSYVFFIH